MKTNIKLFCVTLLINTSVYAEVITDGSLGNVTSLSGNMTIPQSLGTTVGNNLYHSFNTFNINTGESATFTGNNALKNVISRVTGGQPSNINGSLQSTVGKADFYFINPAGVTLGASAQVDVPAAFHLSTADTLRFADGSQFNANNVSANTLSVAEPTGFGFINNQGGDITVQDNEVDFKEGSTVSLSAHNVVLNNGWLKNPSGNMQVYATGKAAELPITPTPPNTQTLTGRIELNAGSLLDTSGNNAGGIINMQGGDISVRDGSLVTNSTFGSGNAGNISIQANNLSVSNKGQITSETFSTGNAGLVSIKANDLTVSNAGLVSSSTYGTGQAGNVVIEAGHISVNGQGNAAAITSNSENEVLANAGNAGSVSIKGNNLSVLNGGQIQSNTLGAGNAGNIEINVGNVLVDGQGNSASISSSSVNSDMANAGNAGTVSIKSNNLSVLNFGVLGSDTWGSGNAGDVAITASNILVDGQGNAAWISSNSNDDQLTNAGNAGNISITADKINVSNGGTISTDTFGTGRGGSIDINATDIAINGQGGSQFTGVASNTNNDSVTNAGNAGTVSINASSVSVSNNGQIASDTWGTGHAGDIGINANSLLVDGQGNNAWVSSSSRNTVSPNSGNAGTVNINANKLNVVNNGQLTTLTSGAGNAGNIIVNSHDTVIDNGLIHSNSDSGSTGNAGSISITGSNSITARNSASVSSSTSGAGRAGNVFITAPVINVDNASISAEASTQSQGQTGDINITALNAIHLANHSKISLKNDATIADPAMIIPSSITVSAPDIDLKDSEITTASTGNVDAGDIHVNFSHWLSLDPSFIATTANTGNGGTITVSGGELIYLQDSGFLTSVSGANSNGGNINITADYLVMDTGIIQANAVGGSGGNIDINLKALIASQNRLILGGKRVAWQPYSGLNIIQAASENGVSGAVNVTSPQFDISASVSGLDSAQLVMPNIDNSLCQTSAMLGSSLARGGKGGIPADETQHSYIPIAIENIGATNSMIATTETSTLSGASLPCAQLQP
jgi:filamentous hemagglutinin family protein